MRLLSVFGCFKGRTTWLHPACSRFLQWKNSCATLMSKKIIPAYSGQHECLHYQVNKIGNDMLSSKRHVSFVGYIFILKCFTKSSLVTYSGKGRKKNSHCKTFLWLTQVTLFATDCWKIFLILKLAYNVRSIWLAQKVGWIQYSNYNTFIRFSESWKSPSEDWNFQNFPGERAPGPP